ncbi:MAG: hypothetical protein ACI94Y_000673 [Maribacter sp.]|jgi:hypothetical protein
MFALSIVITITTINLFKMITNDSTAFYKDIRFWVVLASLITLLAITVNTQAI